MFAFLFLNFLSFFFNDTATTEIYTLSLHDALPISLKPRTLMSSIMRARSALTGRSEGWEVIGDPLELKVAGPSMLGIGYPGRHVLPLTPPQNTQTVTRAPIPRERVRSWGIRTRSRDQGRTAGVGSVKRRSLGFGAMGETRRNRV